MERENLNTLETALEGSPEISKETSKKSKASQAKGASHKVGDLVSYGLHGKCMVTAIETREMASGSSDFYLLRVLKNPIIAKTPARNEAAIWIPVISAKDIGLRALMTKEEAEAVIKLLADADHYFELKQPWVAKQKLLETVIRKEGAIGLAKVVGHMHVLVKKDNVPPTAIIRFYETVHKLLSKELAEVMELDSKQIDALTGKALKAKLTADH